MQNIYAKLKGIGKFYFAICKNKISLRVEIDPASVVRGLDGANPERKLLRR